MLTRQRRFVADASHELRTPLTSVLANLELLRPMSRRCTATWRRRRARPCAPLSACAGWSPTCCCWRGPTPHACVAREPCDLARIVVEAASELGPVSAEHDIALDVHPAIVDGARDELHRLTINLIENALRHTPPGTEIRVSTATTADGEVQLVVEDDGPGVPEELAEHACSSASCAGPATAAAPSGWGSRSSTRSLSPTVAPSS